MIALLGGAVVLEVSGKEALVVKRIVALVGARNESIRLVCGLGLGCLEFGGFSDFR